eukprot:5880991-Prymnesium_polylepis.1
MKRAVYQVLHDGRIGRPGARSRNHVTRARLLPPPPAGSRGTARGRTDWPGRRFLAEGREISLRDFSRFLWTKVFSRLRRGKYEP